MKLRLNAAYVGLRPVPFSPPSTPPPQTKTTTPTHRSYNQAPFPLMPSNRSL